MYLSIYNVNTTKWCDVILFCWFATQKLSQGSDSFLLDSKTILLSSKCTSNSTIAYSVYFNVKLVTDKTYFRLTLVFGLIVLWYEEVSCLSEHSLIAKKEQEVGISCTMVTILSQIDTLYSFYVSLDSWGRSNFVKSVEYWINYYNFFICLPQEFLLASGPTAEQWCASWRSLAV